ncbi:MAG: AMP-binding protein [Candidatus Omnitrophica bacterium]|nr:AMP-binding protein [Candidatus Omnitrophota bacterium]MCF7877715.1 AMP-binding protein [Candidatus Omnitrophota bacterium]MCF7878267.1 AMP-binding protein [Candidatus Omnitrophota bacterium]
MDKNSTLSSLLAEITSKYKDEIAVISQENDEYKKYSYANIYGCICKTASFFKDLGIRKDHFAGLLLENRIEWLISYFALIYNGSIAVPLNPLLRPEEISNLVKDCKAKQIIVSEKIYKEKLDNNQNGLSKIIIVDAKEEKGKIVPFSKAKDYPRRRKPAEIDVSQAVSLLYTSGTTGSPKGVLLTDYNIASNFNSIQKLKLIKRSDNILSILPLFHAYPFMVTLIVPFLSGAKITFFEVSLRQNIIFKVIKEAGVSILVLIPQFYQNLYAKIFEKINSVSKIIQFLIFPLLRIKIKKKLGSKLRLMVSGGARLEKHIGKGFKKLGFQFIEGYGLTETSPIATFNPPQKAKFGSVGVPIPDVELKINEPDQSGVGEVCIKGPNLMKGYYKRPDLTKEVIKNDWFYTGDLGFRDKDRYLFLTGRKNEVIVLSSGKNIYPQDVEEVYQESPYIKEICVIARKRQGQEDESLFGVVVPDTEFFRQKNESDIKGKIRWQIEEISTQLPNYQRIHDFTITKQELPKTALGKIERYKVKEKYSQKKGAGQTKKKRKAEDDPDIEDKEKAKKIINFISESLGREVYLDDHLELDLGIDSLARVELAAGAEEKFSLKLPEDFFLQVSTVKDLILKIITYRKEEKGEEFSGSDWKNILKKEPQAEIKRKLKIKTVFFDILVSYAMKVFLFCFFKLFLRFKIKGKENIPAQRPFIICANHTSYFDGFLIFSALFFKHSTKTFFIGYRDIFELPAFRWAIRLARLIPIDATTQLLESMRAAAYVLTNQQILCLFPEGERTSEGRLQKFKKGIGILLKELDIDVLPVYIKGSYQAWPRGETLPRPHPVAIYFGKVTNAKKLLKKHQPQGENQYAKISRALRAEIKEIQENAK